MNYYPDQLRRIASICNALDEIDGANVPETSGAVIGFQQGIPVVDESGTVFGTLRDEIGGAWSFFPVTEES